MSSSTVSILTELPESLHETLADYLEHHPDRDQDQVLIAALSFFLMHSGCDRNSQAARTYLDTLLNSFA
ncbi:MAG: DUF2811 domain-containing protein [Myxacorys chilensis ATA2-1-KO14]|jgi:hypothetical protein|nr:DUF2811 domain-containing protein [Myxacorys chilensis ATA2-1-KO14]